MSDCYVLSCLTSTFVLHNKYSRDLKSSLTHSLTEILPYKVKFSIQIYICELNLTAAAVHVVNISYLRILVKKNLHSFLWLNSYHIVIVKNPFHLMCQGLYSSLPIGVKNNSDLLHYFSKSWYELTLAGMKCNLVKGNVESFLCRYQ